MEVRPPRADVAENAGLDPIDMVLDLRKAHKSGKKYAGLDVHTGKIEHMKKQNVLEPVRVGTQALSSATEAAVMILRIDDIIAAKAGAGGGGPPPGMGGGMPPGMGGMGGMDY